MTNSDLTEAEISKYTVLSTVMYEMDFLVIKVLPQIN